MKFWEETTINKIRQGYYSAAYFNRTKQILLNEKNLEKVTLQIFQKNNNIMLGGIDETVELLKIGTGYFENNKWIDKSDTLEIKAVKDGEIIASSEPILHITGPYAYFAHLESVYLGILARRTNVANRVKRVVKVANKKPILFFADRFDYFLNQEGDGYAARLGGVSGVATEAQTFLWNGKPIGTIPHALIAACQGDTVKACQLFAKHYPDIPLVALVDFDNDCVNTAVKVAQALGERLSAVRLDTSESIIDKSVQEDKVKGVTPNLVKKVRQALDQEKGQHIKIIVSGGFNPERVVLFEKTKTPVDAYGIGSWFLQGTNPFTADIVKVEGNPIAKVGRQYLNNPRMIEYH